MTAFCFEILTLAINQKKKNYTEFITEKILNKDEQKLQKNTRWFY